MLVSVAGLCLTGHLYLLFAISLLNQQEEEQEEVKTLSSFPLSVACDLGQHCQSCN